MLRRKVRENQLCWGREPSGPPSADELGTRFGCFDEEQRPASASSSHAMGLNVTESSQRSRGSCPANPIPTNPIRTMCVFSLLFRVFCFSRPPGSHVSTRFRQFLRHSCAKIDGVHPVLTAPTSCLRKASASFFRACRTPSGASAAAASSSRQKWKTYTSTL